MTGKILLHNGGNSSEAKYVVGNFETFPGKFWDFYPYLSLEILKLTQNCCMNNFFS